MVDRLRARLTNLVRRRRVNAELDEELQFHLEREVEAHRAAGATPDEARRRALRDLGGVTQTREAVHDTRDSRWRVWLSDARLDLAYTVRLLRRSPAFTLIAVLVLTLGIGINTALFSIVNSFFFRTLPVERPEELVYLAEPMNTNEMWAVVDPPAQEQIRTRGADLMSFTSHWAMTRPLTALDETQLTVGEYVEHNYFDVLGVKPLLGRALAASEDDPASTEHAIVVSHDLWSTRLKSDPSVIGQKIRLGDHFVTVVGVMPPGFRGLSDPWAPTQFWAGLQEMWGASSRKYSDGPIARMKPGVTLAQVRAFLAAQSAEIRDARLRRLTDQRFVTYARQYRIEAYRAQDVDIPLRPESTLVPTTVLVAVTTVVGLVLIIATANVTGLLLARGVTRAGELAVRRALGAGGSRLVRQLLTESVVLAVIGGGLGVVVSQNLVTMFERLSPSKYVVDVHLDWRVFAFATVTCLAVGVLVGIAPALQAAAVNVLEALGQGIASARRLRVRLRHGIVVPQIALSLVLLLVAGVHTRALTRIELSDLGYRPDHAVVLNIGRWEPSSTAEQQLHMTAAERKQAEAEYAEKQRTFTRAVLAKLARLGSVTAFGLSEQLPLGTFRPQPAIAIPDASGAPSASGAAGQVAVTDGYFAAMGMTMRQGRTFDGRDGYGGVKTAVITATLAKRLWPAGNAIGHSLTFATDGHDKPEWLEVIGVVEDVEPVLHDTHDQYVYVSALQQWRPGAGNLVVRFAGTPSEDALQSVRRAVVDADTFGEVRRIQTMTQMVDEILYPRRIAAGVLLVAGLIGLGLACLGLYGVVSYSVAQRVREIGIRATLGADRRDLVALILREGFVVLVTGLLAGSVLSAIALKLTAGLIPGVPLVDLVAIVVAPVSLALVVLAACYLPARRAARLDPMQVLRQL